MITSELKSEVVKLFMSFDPTQSILIIYTVCTCKFIYVEKFICNSKTNTLMLLPSFMERHQAAKNLSGLVCMLSAETEQSNANCIIESITALNKCPSPSLFCAFS